MNFLQQFLITLIVFCISAIFPSYTFFHIRHPSKYSYISNDAFLPFIHCPTHHKCTDFNECYKKHITCGFKMTSEQFSRSMIKKGCQYGVCCPYKVLKCSRKKKILDEKKSKMVVTKPPVTTQTTAPSTIKPEIITVNNNYSGIRTHPNFHLLAGPHCGFGLYPRVAFGVDVAPGELPWMVMLKYRVKQKLAFRCGGALVSSRYVLTAAHCLVDQDKTFALISVRLGEVDLGTWIDCMDVEGEGETNTTVCSEGPQEIKIERAIPHPNFSLTNILRGFPDDIGLIRLKDEAELSDFVKPICMVGLANPAVRGDKGINLQNFEVAGWGMVSMKENPRSTVLRRVNVKAVNKERCFELLRRKIDDCQLCAGGEHGNTCRGDSGGPLMAKVLGEGEEMCPLLVGVISYGTIDCGHEIPSVFCEASCYLKWILDNVED